MDYAKISFFLDKMRDLVISEIFYVIPSFFRWIYHLKIKKDITEFPIRDAEGNEVYLYLHGKNEVFAGKDVATLILHGLYGHPAVMLHLAEVAQEVNLGPVYSLYIKYDKDTPEKHRPLIRKALEKIEALSQNAHHRLKGIILAGHSMGGIEAAYSAFVERNPRVIAVISIAGRLKVVEEECSDCSALLLDTFNQIYQGIQELPDFPLFQIVGENDWSSSLKSTLIRNDPYCSYIIPNAGHLNLLFYKDMGIKFAEFLKKSVGRDNFK